MLVTYSGNSLPACRLKAVEEGRLNPLKMPWTSIEKEVSEDFRVGRSYVSQMQCIFIED